MSRFWFFTSAALLGTFLAFATNPFAHAADFKDSGSIARGLTAVTDDSGRRRPSVDLDVRFRVNSAELTQGARRQLDALGAALKDPALASAQFGVHGHTDATGDAAHNQALSERRAAAVKAYLVRHHAIPASRLVAKGMGEDRPRNPYNPEAAENRRVEIVNLVPAKPVGTGGAIGAAPPSGGMEAIGR